MAKGPQTQDRDAVRRQTEAVIDKHIKDSPGDRIIIRRSLLPSRFDASDWYYLREKYKAAGWRIANIVFDQRDGDFIDLQA